ncbi:hypothetical protein JTB14_004492 [Gonioctena quinquepunctata]|nr:hypothetical protein JTB14_004492 [Gonioctena quinquepunctata]
MLRLFCFRFSKNIEQKKSWCDVLGVSMKFYFSPEKIRNLPAGKKSLVEGAIPIAVSVLQPMNIERLQLLKVLKRSWR